MSASLAPGTAANPVPALLARLGLARSPFPPTPDSANYFETDALRRDLAEVTHCLLARKGFALLTGEVGRGKTTFLRRVLADVEAAGARTSLVVNTFLQGHELLAAVLRDFGLKPGDDAAVNLARLDAFLVKAWREGTPCVLFIDDAQNLQPESLELLRLLSNLESGQEKLLQVLLTGQPELEVLLERHELRQLASRIVRHVRLPAFDDAQTAAYVAFRLQAAGGDGLAVTDGAAAALHRDSAGNPRRIHLIMDRCLYGLIARRTTTVDAALVRRAAAEAGFARTRRRWPRALAAAALVAVLAGVAAAGVHLRGTAPAALPAQAMAAATAPAPQSTFDTCIAHLTRASGGVETMHLAPAHAALVRHRADVCEDSTTAGRIARALPAGIDARHATLQLQQRLAAHGAFAATAGIDPVDGRIGPRTRDALLLFQSRHALAPTGEADAATRLLLDAAPPARATAPEPENPHGRS